MANISLCILSTRCNSQLFINCQKSLRYLKRNSYKIVGYARKTPSNDNLGGRASFLQKMVNALLGNSFTSIIYVSTLSYISVPFSEQD
ncbi:hypothetical protein J3Q64DRAFT_1649020 [Phycomyces blakesleeanus]|uniref:Resolvase/invertase-type recombinase catalytic domain-containing protein n=1 Tax=Phycomyces blakesleeanus TaxID=4837 RepID=A0ABR3AIZ2_PHYBL